MTKQNQHHLVVTAIAITVVTVVFSLIALITVRIITQSNDRLYTTTQPLKASNPPPTQITLASPSDTWIEGDSHFVTISITRSAVPPMVASLIINFDPELLAVQDVATNTYWTTENVFQNDIDTETGQVKLQLAQGFDGHPSGSTILATINFTATETGSSIITLDSRSNIASINHDQTIPLDTNQLNITIQ